MTDGGTQAGRRRSRRPIFALLLLGMFAAVLVFLGPGWLGGLRIQDGLLRVGPECTVETPEGEIGLDRDEAKRASTAAALLARGLEADTSGLDAAVLQQLADGPSEDAGPSLACRGSAASDLPAQQPGPTGLTPRAEKLREVMTGVFGDQSLGGFAPGGIDRGHGADSTHYDGRAIDIFFRPVTEENRRKGWMLAHWLVAHADDLDIQYVIFDDRIWSAHSLRGKWQDYNAPEPANEILRHRDHVHVDVLGGGPDANAVPRPA